MEAEKAAEAMAVRRSHDMAIRESGQPASIPANMPPEHARGASGAPNGHMGNIPSDVWSGAVSRLQTQSSYNTGLLESHRRQFAEIDTTIQRFSQGLNNAIAQLNELRGEIRNRPSVAAPEPPHVDPSDLEILTSQVSRLTSGVNEIENLRIDVKMLRNRVKRLEEAQQHGPSPMPLPPQNSQYREPPHYEQSVPPQSHPPQPPMQPQHPAQHQPLPPMRTNSLASPSASRPPSFPAQQAGDAHPPPPYAPPPEPRSFSGEPTQSHAPPPPPPPPSQPGPTSFRPSEPLPPPSSLSAWRPAESYGPPGMSPPNAPIPSSRPHTMEPELQTAGWTTVNPAMKRPPEDRPSPYHSPLIDGAKRPKLAPLMPSTQRGAYGEEGYNGTPPSYPSAPVGMSGDPALQPRSRAASDGSQPQNAVPPPPPPPPPGQVLPPPPTQPPPPAAAGSQHNYRFITSTAASAEAPEGWRPDVERITPTSNHAAPGRGRGGRGRGRGRGRGGRGGASAPTSAMPPSSTPIAAQLDTHPPQEHGTPEWEKSELPPHQMSPNGYAAPPPPPPPPPPPSQHPYSPSHGTRGILQPRRVDPHMTGVPPERHHEFPSTPIQASPQDSYPIAPDGSQHTSGGKKTRTKPFRNSEGILIRKDGRPDMRSVSSANNLRKVHAKKEAERAEMEGDEDEVITRSGTPVSTSALPTGDSTSPDGDSAFTRPSSAAAADRQHREAAAGVFSPPGGPADAAQHQPGAPRFASSRPATPAYAKPEPDFHRRRSGEDVVMKEQTPATASHDRPTRSTTGSNNAGSGQSPTAASTQHADTKMTDAHDDNNSNSNDNASAGSSHERRDRASPARHLRRNSQHNNSSSSSSHQHSGHHDGDEQRRNMHSGDASGSSARQEAAAA